MSDMDIVSRLLQVIASISIEIASHEADGHFLKERANELLQIYKEYGGDIVGEIKQTYKHGDLVFEFSLSKSKGESNDD